MIITFVHSIFPDFVSEETSLEILSKPLCDPRPPRQWRIIIEANEAEASGLIIQ